MNPMIPPGSKMRLQCDLDEPRVGEVIAYRRGSTLIVHRLIEIREDSSGAKRYVCKGDASPGPDSPIPLEAIVGRIARVRKPSRIRQIKRRIIRRLGNCLKRSTE
jgi:signal peptidase I